MLDHINNQHFEERLIKYFSKLSLSQIIIGHTHASLNFLTGKSLKEFAANNNLSLAKSFLKLMRVTRLKVICLYKEVDLRLLEKFMVSPNAIIASNGFKQTFFQFLQWTTEHDAKQLERAIAKITSIPAQKYNISKRGLIKEDYYADINILRDNQPSEVIINGQLVLNQGIPQKILAGQILKHHEA